MCFPQNITIHPTILKYVIYLHNAGLHIFSGYIAYNLIQWFIELGFNPIGNFYLNYKDIDTLIYYFYLSKYYEYVDTFILYSKKRKPIFLQKFHHVGAVIVWHTLYYLRSDSLVFTTLFNSFVHTFMYLYYLLTAMKFKVIKYKIYITVLQLAQLTSGLFIFIYNDGYNKEHIVSSVMFIFYVGTLILLFLKFFIVNYIFGVKAE